MARSELVTNGSFDITAILIARYTWTSDGRYFAFASSDLYRITRVIVLVSIAHKRDP